MSTPSTTQAHPDLPLTYLIRQPLTELAPSEKPPVLVMAHGVGSNERDLFSFASELDPRLLILSVRAPLTMGPEAYGWFEVEFSPTGPLINVEQLDASRRRFAEFLTAALVGFPVNPERVYLLGFSQGAIISLITALTTPETLAGVIALSGRIPHQALPWAVAPERTAGLPIFQAHGVADTVIRIGDGRAARDALERQQIALGYHEYPMAHTVSPATFADFTAWLTTRLDGPRRILKDAIEHQSNQ